MLPMYLGTSVAISISSTSRGSRNLASNIATCWPRDLFLHLYPHDSTYSRASPRTLGQCNQFRNNDNVLATTGCPCWQCIKTSRSGTMLLGTTSTDVRLINVPLRFISSHRRRWSAIRYLLISAYVKSFCLGISPWVHNVRLSFPEKGSAVRILNK